MLTLTCPNPDCGKSYHVDDTAAGKTARCKACGSTITIAAAAAETHAEGPAEPGSSSLSSLDPPSPGSRPAAEPAKVQSQSEPLSKATPTDAASEVPQKLGRFQIQERVGAGAFGTVYRAFDPTLERDVALKVPRPEAYENEADLARLMREPKAAAKLHHANIVPVHEVGRDGKQIFIASTFIRGQTLAQAIRQRRFQPDEAAKLVAKLADALAHAHEEGIVHRDVKPENVMLDKKGEPYLMDFGLARLQQANTQLTQEGTVLGTPLYMSPEQASPKRGKVGPASDQYSLGVVLYQLLCGQTPFEGPVVSVMYQICHEEPPPPCQINSEIPARLEAICLQAMAKDSADRFSSAAELATALQQYLDDKRFAAWGPTASTFLNDLSQASAIFMQIDWTGLSEFAPIQRHYSLKPVSDGFAGRAHFSVACPSRESTADITIPHDVADNFLKTLAGTPLEKGKYIPRQEWTDDYPEVSIELEVAGKTIIFFSSSQGEGNAPWKITVEEEEYISQSTTPADALATLNPYLASNVFEVLIESVEKSEAKTKALIVFLLDQSCSMEEPLGDSASLKKDELATAINGWLENMVIGAIRGDEEVTDCMDVAILGYRTDIEANPIIESPLSGALTGRELVSIVEIAEHISRMETRRRTAYDENSGEPTEIEVEVPIWVEPVADGGRPMCWALYRAHELVEAWIEDHPSSFPPIVINVTGGESYDGDPVPYAEALCELETELGNVLLFNCYLSETTADSFLFPHSDEILPDELARVFFRMSSELPEFMYNMAQDEGYELQPGARGMVFNADPIQLVKLATSTAAEDKHFAVRGVPDAGRKVSSRGDQQELANSIGMKFVLIPAGEFLMGSPEAEEGRWDIEQQHRVQITKPFYLSAYPVTQEQYEEVMGKNPSSFKGTNLPVERVNWDDAVEFCQKLSQQEGKTYRLPTEAEWEYACRAGSTTTYSFGDDASQLDQYAWYEDNSGTKTHPVGSKQANAWGLFDMHGNVWEWCADWYDEDYYARSPRRDPLGPSGGSYEIRVNRGGGWYDHAGRCRAALRHRYPPSPRHDALGFRVFLVPSGE